MRPHLLALAVLFFATSACSGLSGAPRATFDQYALNQPWYGAYHRPLPAADARSASPRASRPERPSNTAARRDSDAATARPSPPPPNTTGAPSRYDSGHAAAYVRDVYAINETPIGDGGRLDVLDVYRHVQDAGTIYHNPRPAVGDLVFFHNTHDANGDSRPNDWYTHVGIVEAVADDATVTVLSYVDGAVGRFRMNLENAGDERVDGTVVNTHLRQTRRDDPPHMETLAGRLFAGFGSLLGERTQVVVLDTWQPSDSPSLRASR